MLNNNNIIYLDSAALVQKPIAVIKAINDFYTKYCISNRTSDSKIGIKVGQKIDQTRIKVANLLNCKPDEIIFNSGTTDGLNYISNLMSELIKEGDEIIVSKYNHSSHMVPWIEVAKQKNAKVIFSDNLIDDISDKTKIIAFTQSNNNFQNNIDIKLLSSLAKKHNAILINDAAQAISHEKVDAKYFDAIAFSSNKMFGPTGIGVLYICEELLNKISVKKYGGGMVENIDKNGNWKSKNSILKHEPGTLNLSGIFGFYEALKFYENIDKNMMNEYLDQLCAYAYKELSKINDINILSNPKDRIILFEVKNISAQDLASYLGHKDVYVRSGWFCAQYLKNMINNPVVRVSLHIYNNKEDIDSLCELLSKGSDFLDFI
ncbi:MAG: aminotransferase class V-fold PLP-dependent enzyme [Mycoplasma sp.]|nr:aminotransferase class V-fold PLP-dependent enzyme [Mycoplasma sp.]